MKIATFNINSINAHSESFFDWLKLNEPDIVFLQEIKCENEKFLYFECETLGYRVAVLGQKSYNGVAILCKYKFTITSKNLPTFTNDTASRYIEILVDDNNTKFYAASIYAPNGCANNIEVQNKKFDYKLKWFDELYNRIASLRTHNLPIILGGDFNVMMEDIDVFDAEKFKNSPLFTKEIHNKIYALKYLGLYDSFRLQHKNKEGFTFWDYTGNSFVTNSGLRIDYLFISSFFAERLERCEVDKSLRQSNRPSDHTALIASFRSF